MIISCYIATFTHITQPRLDWGNIGIAGLSRKKLNRRVGISSRGIEEKEDVEIPGGN